MTHNVGKAEENSGGHEKLVPQLSELDQERLLAFGEGLAFMSGARELPAAQDSA